jgi:hypothetical protein
VIVLICSLLLQVENSETTFSCDADGNVTGIATANRYPGNLKYNHDGGIVWNNAFVQKHFINQSNNLAI